MDIPRPDGPDVSQGSPYLATYWTLTAFACVVLSVRYCIKAWIYWGLPQVSMPLRIWGLDDIFYALGALFDVGHVALLTKSCQWGLGRHFYYLSFEQRTTAMMFSWISQPVGICASIFARTGIFCFLYKCLVQHNGRLRWVIIACGIAQIVVNLVTILQILLQCGPNPYRPVNRFEYFHYLWDGEPQDGSVVCQPPSEQVIVAYVNCACNAFIDSVLTCLTAMEIWQCALTPLSIDGGGKVSWTAPLKDLDPHIRNQRIWQTLLLCGPLMLSGTASIVKATFVSAIGSREDFTWNIMMFLLWARIENSTLLISTSGPVFRLYTRSVTNRRRNTRVYRRSHELKKPPGEPVAHLSGKTLTSNSTAICASKSANTKVADLDADLDEILIERMST